MTTNIVYRTLARAEINKLLQLDRSETINHIYYLRQGKLVLENEPHDVPDWSFPEKQKRINYLEQVFDKGATFYGAFDEAQLIGLAILDHNFLLTGHKRLNLEGLWVSHAYRGRSVGRTLVQLLVKEAFTRGAESLYVSATPSENTVGFYLNLGCRLADPIDPTLFEKEPEDIHLELVLIHKINR